MCAGCWIEYGSPQIDSPQVREAARAVDAVYDHSSVGGNLHVIIDDWNLEDDSLTWCEREGLPLNYSEADAEQLEAERACLRLLQALTVEERASALALSNDNRFWTP